MLKVSDTYVVGVDISEEDDTVVTVAKYVNGRMHPINTFTGEQGRKIYEELILKPGTQK